MDQTNRLIHWPGTEMLLTPLFWSQHYLKFAQDLGGADTTSGVDAKT